MSNKILFLSVSTFICTFLNACLSVFFGFAMIGLSMFTGGGSSLLFTPVFLLIVLLFLSIPVIIQIVCLIQKNKNEIIYLILSGVSFFVSLIPLMLFIILMVIVILNLPSTDDCLLQPPDEVIENIIKSIYFIIKFKIGF